MPPILTDLLQHGLLQGSFIPSAPIRHLRDLTRNRARTVQEAARIKSRIQKVLEEANIKLGSVATDVLGVSGRLMLEGLVAGKQSPAEPADLAVGVQRKKRDELEQALRGKTDDHHRLMLDKLLRALKTREREIAEDEEDIRRQVEPFRKAVLAWTQLPGIDEITAWSLVAEMGADMAPFDTAEQAASWACVCPGNHESAGKQRDGRTRKGNPWLRSAIREAAWARHAPRNPTFTLNTPGSARAAVRDEP
jgi:transposase